MSLKELLPGKLGYGTAPLGNMFRAIPDQEAAATVEAAWQHGVRYYDTAPFYGAGRGAGPPRAGGGPPPPPPGGGGGRIN
ncbi:aldo/keto reductase, partial [Kitasatospora sp. NPDC059817]|uniref:aldo/keto reductase n=1 Tax=Kitasatospora sp. NPDC059817 TaxID=3346961 RepID=UPI0036573E68